MRKKHGLNGGFAVANHSSVDGEILRQRADILLTFRNKLLRRYGCKSLAGLPDGPLHDFQRAVQRAGLSGLGDIWQECDEKTISLAIGSTGRGGAR
jgi:hypothetical protein